jgi:hypothetical protein
MNRWTVFNKTSFKTLTKGQRKQREQERTEENSPLISNQA